MTSELNRYKYLFIYIGIDSETENDFDYFDFDYHDNGARQNHPKKVGKTFENRNGNAVPLQRKKMAPTCGSKNSHVQPQKTIHYSLLIIH